MFNICQLLLIFKNNVLILRCIYTDGILRRWIAKGKCMKNKSNQLKKFGITIKNRRTALNLSVRELSKQSGISAALISKLENGLMQNFPKAITIEHLSKVLKFERNELFVLADILFEPQKTPAEENWQDSLRILLATSTDLSATNIEQSIFFIQGLETLQKIESLD